MTNHPTLRLIQLREQQVYQTHFEDKHLLLSSDIEKLVLKLDFLEKHMSYQFRKISINEGGKIQLVPISSIIRCESSGNYCHIYLDNGTNHLISKTLKSIESKIGHPFFHRIHQSHLINQNHITSIFKRTRQRINLTDRVTLPVSRNFNIQNLIQTVF